MQDSISVPKGYAYKESPIAALGDLYWNDAVKAWRNVQPAFVGKDFTLLVAKKRLRLNISCTNISLVALLFISVGLLINEAAIVRTQEKHVEILVNRLDSLEKFTKAFLERSPR